MGDLELQAFSDRLKELRLSLGLTQTQFVEELGITAAALSAYEKNQKNPSISVAKRIAEKYHISIDWLCGLTDKKNYNEDINNYADMFQLIIKLCEIPDGGWLMSYEDNDTLISSFNTIPSIAKLSNTDDIVIEFFRDWEQMYKLYKNNTINQHLYNLWLSDKLKYYKEISFTLPFDVDPALQGNDDTQ